MKIFKILSSLLLTSAILILGVKPALAFCGFYVAKADSSLYNQASQVIIARDSRRTVLTMSNDYQGDVKDFAMVIPVPVVLKEEQVNIADPKIIDRLDAFSSPRLVEYFDEDPACPQFRYETLLSHQTSSNTFRKSDNVLGVDVEEQFSVGEYDIVILSARKSKGLETWLIKNGYKIPSDAKELLQPYIRQKMKFLVAKVNLEEFDSNVYQQLRPISIAYESPKFMLPIRLGMTNAQGEQDLIVYLLSPEGQVELTNYRTVKIPADKSIPEYVKYQFGDFYQAMFQKSYDQENQQAAILEYAWNMKWCDPCAANPLNREELKQAGVFWLDRESKQSWLDRFRNQKPVPPKNDVFITRLHVRYNRDRFPEDLIFQATSNQESFQGRYIIHHPYTQEIGSTCKVEQTAEKQQLLLTATETYQEKLAARKQEEVQNLANLTGWDINKIREEVAKPIPWWRDLWN